MRKQAPFGNLCAQNTGRAVGSESGERRLPAGLGPEHPSGRSRPHLAGGGRQAEACPKGTFADVMGPSGWTQDRSQVTVGRPGSGQHLWPWEGRVLEAPLAMEGPAAAFPWSRLMGGTVLGYVRTYQEASCLISSGQTSSVEREMDQVTWAR